MIAALSLDLIVALALAGLAAAWLVRRAIRTFAPKKAGGCGCANESACGPKGPGLADLKAAAARAVDRVNRTGGDAR